MTKKNANVALLFVFLHTIVQVGLKINEFILLHVNYTLYVYNVYFRVKFFSTGAGFCSTVRSLSSPTQEINSFFVEFTVVVNQLYIIFEERSRKTQ